MKNLATISVGPAFRSLEMLGRRLPDLLLVQYVRAVEIIMLSVVVLAGAGGAAQLLFGQTAVPESTAPVPASLRVEKIPRIEQLQQQRALQAQQGLLLVPRPYFELPPASNP